MDRISNLPDEIIHHIGTFLSAKEAAFASVLSKRWRNVFIIPELRFDGDEDDGEPFKDFVDKVLALPVSSWVGKVSLKCNDVAQDDEHISRCLCNVVKRGVSALELEIKSRQRRMLLTAFSSVYLRDSYYNEACPKREQKHETLSLDSVRFYGFRGRCAFETLLSACPVLEELVIDGIELERWKRCCNFSSPTLRRLTIRSNEWQPYDEEGEPIRREWESDDEESDEESVRLDCGERVYGFDRISFDIPGLTYLEYSGFVPKEYLIVNLDSLVEAKLDLHGDGRLWSELSKYGFEFDPMNLIDGIKNVKILDLSIYTVDMFDVFRESIPVFENLFQVTIRFINFCWFPLPTLIKKSPNLKTLIIEDLHCGYGEDGLVCQCVSEYSFLLACPVEVLKIHNYRCDIGHLEQVKHFLKKLSSLELVEVHARVPAEEKLQVMANLLMLPRASPKCKIKVKFS